MKIAPLRSLHLERHSCLPLLAIPSIQRGGRACSSVVEHLTFNQRVVGSYPTGLTNNFNGLGASIRSMQLR